jgi:putative ABC transport system permease protein
LSVLSLALRNLLRNRRRTIATLSAIALGGASVLLFGGYSADINHGLQTGYIRSGGHLQIQHRDYFLFGSGDPTAYGIAHYAAILDAIQSDPVLREMVLVATPMLQLDGVAGNYAAGVSRTVFGTGLVADDHVRLRAWNRFGIALVAPPMRLAGTAPNAAVIGEGVARVLLMCEALKVANCPTPERTRPGGGANLPSDIAQLSLSEAATRPAAAAAAGRKIELLASSARGAPNVASLNVVSAENQGYKELDEVTVLMHLAQAQRLVYGASPPKVTAIAVQLQDTAQLPVAMARVAEMLPQWSQGETLVARDFSALNPFYAQSIQLFDAIFGFMFVLIGSIVMFTVSNTMNTAVVERTVEIGTLRAIGLRRSGIRRMFVAEGFLLGIGGTLLGVGVALVAAWAVNLAGLQWQPPGSVDEIPLAIKVWGEWTLLAGTAIGLVALTTLSAWWPAYRGAQLNVVDALRHA